MNGRSSSGVEHVLVTVFVCLVVIGAGALFADRLLALIHGIAP